MGLPLSEIARLVDGNLTGSDLEITGAATLSAARPGEITLADNPKLAPKLARSEASASAVGLFALGGRSLFAECLLHEGL